VSTERASSRRQVEKALREAIAEHGPITFAEFMEIALYGPGGFYEQPPIGERGHFVTSPHVHPVFGRLLARALRSLWESIGSPEPFRLVELGAGDGTLAAQLGDELGDIPKEYVAVERSSGARQALGELDPPVRVVASLEALDQHVHGCIVANELLDNLPFRRATRDDDDGLLEVLVGDRDGRFIPLRRPFPDDDDEVREAVPNLAPGTDGPVPLGALHLVDRLARVLRRGYVLLIDYAAGPNAEIHGYREQRKVSDILDSPGTADITAGVDFGMLAERSEALGLRSFTAVTQRSALLALGFERWAEDERMRQTEAQDRRSGRDAVAAWSGRNAARMLVDPAGLGGLRWWLLATQGLDPPDWLLEALATDMKDGVPVPSEDAGMMAVDVSGRRRRRRRTRCP
jgi:SAM-dependent MidA family methyltransferase